MDISANIGGGYQPAAGAAKPKLDIPLNIAGKASGVEIKAPQAVNETVALPANAQDAEKARLDVLKQAAEISANLYPVGENAVAIYKSGSSGELIFRVRSLKTGEVKEIPEHVAIDVARLQGSKGVGVEIEV